MKEKDLTSLEELKESIACIKERFCKSGENRLFFRGQRDSKWELKTTLERTISGPLKFIDYYKLIFAAKPLIDKLETTIPACSDFECLLDQEINLSTYRYNKMLSPESLKYFAYLRHHDFPSPFLDWTSNINVSLYFAFKHSSDHIPESGYASIYCYLEMPYGYKFSKNGHKIYIIENDYLGVDRHEAQEGRYSMCVKHEKLSDNKYYAIFFPHDSIFSFNQVNQDTQDLLWKFNVPFSENAAILEILDQEGYTHEKMGFNESFSATSS